MRRIVSTVSLIACLVASSALLAQGKQKTVAELVTAKEYQAAVNQGVKAIEAGTADFALYCSLGVAYYNLKDYPRSIDMLQKATVLNGESAVPYMNLATTYHDMGQEEQAVESLGKAAALDPTKMENYFVAAYDAGKAFFDKEEWAKAEPLLRRAVEAKPDDVETNLGLAQCLQHLKKHGDAIPYFQKLLALNTSDAKKPAYLGKIAECQYFSKQFTDAAVTAEKILEIRPNDERALLFRAGSYIELKDCARAVPAVESYLAISKNNAARLPMLKGMALCLYDQKKFKESAAAYEQAYAIDPKDEDVLLFAGNSYAQLKNSQKAVSFFKKLIAITSDASLKATLQKAIKQAGG